jgi:aminopeptidase N
VWLSEGFATYYTLLFRQHLYGQDDFIQGLKDARGSIVNFYDENYDFQIVRDYIENLNDVSGPMMYSKGAWTLHMLRSKIGVEAYNAAIRSYYGEFMNRNAQTADLRRHMEEASGESLDAFFQQWLFQGGIPELNGSWSVRGNQLTIDLEQVQPTYEFELPVEFRVEFADGSTEDVTLTVGPGEPVTATHSFDAPVAGVTIDPNTRLLAKWSFNRS